MAALRSHSRQADDMTSDPPGMLMTGSLWRDHSLTGFAPRWIRQGSCPLMIGEVSPDTSHVFSQFQSPQEIDGMALADFDA